MGSKNNPGDFDCYANAEPDEPMFILLGRDPAACTLVRQWADMRELDGMEPTQLAEARACADWMEKWARDLGKGDRVDRLARPLPEEGDDEAARRQYPVPDGICTPGSKLDQQRRTQLERQRAFLAGAAHGRRQESARRDALPYRDCCNRAVKREQERQERAWGRDYATVRDGARALRDTLAHAYADTPGWRDDARALLAPPSPREPDTTPGRYPPGLRGRNREIEHAAQLAQARDRAERSAADTTAELRDPLATIPDERDRCASALLWYSHRFGKGTTVRAQLQAASQEIRAGRLQAEYEAAHQRGEAS